MSSRSPSRSRSSFGRCVRLQGSIVYGDVTRVHARLFQYVFYVCAPLEMCSGRAFSCVAVGVADSNSDFSISARGLCAQHPLYSDLRLLLDALQKVLRLVGRVAKCSGNASVGHGTIAGSVKVVLLLLLLLPRPRARHRRVGFVASSPKLLLLVPFERRQQRGFERTERVRQPLLKSIHQSERTLGRLDHLGGGESSTAGAKLVGGTPEKAD